MPDYILHIGLPKTGTKYLQGNFRRLSEALHAQGILYPATWWTHDAQVSHDGLVAALRAEDDAALRAAFGGFDASGHRRVLLSCEGLSDLTPAQIARLRALTEGHAVRVVLYCRRWSDWLPSAWQQTVKEGSALTFPEYLLAVFAAPEENTAVNFATIVDAYAAAFGADAVSVVSYSNLADERIDLVAHFFRTVLGWPDPPAGQSGQVHESPGMIATELVRLLNAQKLHGADTANPAGRSLELLRERADTAALLDGLTAAMGGSVCEVVIDDAASVFRPLFDALNASIGPRLLGGTAETRIFTPRRATIRFVRQEYLADPDLAATVQRVRVAAARRAAQALPDGFDLAAAGRFATDTAPSPRARAAWGGWAVEYLAGHPAVAATPCGGITLHLDAAFNAGADGLRLLHSGWYAAEPKFVWSCGRRSILHLPPPAQAESCWLLLVLRAFVDDRRLPAQTVRIQVNGTEIGTVEVSAYSVIECEIPRGALAGHERIEVTLDLPDAAVPAQLGVSSDDRELAVALLRAVVFSLPQPAPAMPAQPKPETPATPPADLANLLAGFESLGENCEFGLVQRRAGIEPLGLLRFASTPLHALVHALRARFAGMGRAETIRVEVSATGREYMVADARYGFLYHAWVMVGEMTPEEIHARECRRLPFLVRKLVEDLTEGAKIFVVHGMAPLAEGQARELAAAVRAYGPGHVLWVERADAAHPPASVEQVEPGLLRGHVDRFAPGENAHDLSFDCWVDLCRNARALLDATTSVRPRSAA